MDKCQREERVMMSQRKIMNARGLKDITGQCNRFTQIEWSRQRVGDKDLLDAGSKMRVDV